ncbi:uncharacterized protein LOC121858445 [Homarus americanus]|uniref:Uncharacterized protein n=1 Tax=Homarus americanus TaxID=6706 RepID=A0A8J5TIT0_HOMAM|nr:uncharacterized protein LOC121858445 [Homarus americanus]KAG7175290.1 hypothetical protein Hamer_G001343 [Homarus americanus]
MSVSEFSEMVRKDAQFLYDNPEALFKDFEDLVYNVIPLKLPEVFLNIPKAKLKMERLSSPHSTTAFYSVGAYDGSRPGVYFVNTFHCDSQPKYEMMTLSLHEGNPGHHLQGSHSMESPKIPFFRRVMEDRNYWQAPSRFPINTAYLEGWGLYAENLGFDMDLFKNPYIRHIQY